jgi:imidazolonepropionase-like amidohydrolase
MYAQRAKYVPWELYIYVTEGGITNMEAIVSATITAAEACGLKNVGILEEGKVADLIVVNGDPLKDIKVLRDTENIHVVMTEGKIQIENSKLIW